MIRNNPALKSFMMIIFFLIVYSRGQFVQLFQSLVLLSELVRMLSFAIFAIKLSHKCIEVVIRYTTLPAFIKHLSQSFKPCFRIIFKQSKSCSNHFVSRAKATTFYLTRDKAIKMVTQCTRPLRSLPFASGDRWRCFSFFCKPCLCSQLPAKVLNGHFHRWYKIPYSYLFGIATCLESNLLIFLYSPQNEVQILSGGIRILLI